MAPADAGSERLNQDLPGARTLPTAALQLTYEAVGDLIAAAAMGVVHGQAGYGKTFAVEESLARKRRPARR